MREATFLTGGIGRLLRRLVFCVGVLVLTGCASVNPGEDPQDSLEHEVIIPKEFRYGKANPNFPSAAERYLYAYDQAWWACVEDFARQIDYEPTTEDHMGNGWPAAIAGYADGYSAAEVRVEKIKHRFGPAKAQELFKKSLEAPL